MKKTEKELLESLAFMSILTLIGGFINAYTFINRGGVFANNQTGNMAKLGIELCRQNWSAALLALYPMLATIAGAFFAEHIKTKGKSPGGWRRGILVIELAALLVVGFLPASIPDLAVTLPLSFIAAWQLSAFRSFRGWVHNTTISTGNLRSVGQYVYQALFTDKSRENRVKTMQYIVVVFSHAFGALVGAGLSLLIAGRAIWFCCLLLVGLIILHTLSLKVTEQELQQQQ